MVKVGSQKLKVTVPHPRATSSRLRRVFVYRGSKPLPRGTRIDEGVISDLVEESREIPVGLRVITASKLDRIRRGFLRAYVDDTWPVGEVIRPGHLTSRIDHKPLYNVGDRVILRRPARTGKRFTMLPGGVFTVEDVQKLSDDSTAWYYTLSHPFCDWAIHRYEKSIRGKVDG